VIDVESKIAVVQGAPSALVQDLFHALVARWQPSLRLAGVIAENHDLPGRGCAAGYLRSLADGDRYAIFQDLGQGSQTCHLAGDGALAAAAAVRRDIENGCDLVVLSKFGKLEAGGGGLRDAFGAAFEAGLPILTSVSPAHIAAWNAFAAPLYRPLPADAESIEAWKQGVVGTRPRAAARTVGSVLPT
jgi:Protein of unknown function (DUF2478)